MKAAKAPPRAPRETKPATRFTVTTSAIAKTSATAIQSSVTASPPILTTRVVDELFETTGSRPGGAAPAGGEGEERGAPPCGGAPLVGGREARSDARCRPPQCRPPRVHWTPFQAWALDET